MIAELLLATTFFSSNKAARVAEAREKSLLRVAYAMAPDVVASAPPKTSGSGGISSSISSTFTASQIFTDDSYLILGTGSDASFGYNTAQTPDALFLGVGQDSRCLIIAEKADAAYDFAHAQSTNPCIFLQSANQSSTEWMSFSFGPGSGGNIQVGSTNGINLLAHSVSIAGPVSYQALGFSNFYTQILRNDQDSNTQSLLMLEASFGVRTAGIRLGAGPATGQARPRHLIPVLPTTLTDATATGIVRVPLPSNSGSGGILYYTITADSAGTWQSRAGSVSFAIRNTAGTETCTFGTASDVLDGAGTLTVAFDCDTSPTNAVSIRINADTSLNVSLTAYWQIMVNGAQTDLIQL